MNSYKEEYNHWLMRYYKGCAYLEKHPEEHDKYIGELLKILDELNRLINVYNITGLEITRGFYIED